MLCTNCVEEPIVEKPGKNKGLIVGLIAGITAIAIAAGCVGGWFLLGNKETLYVMTEKRQYTEDGQLYAITTYDYDKQGRLLSLKQDMGESEAVWDDADGIYRYQYSEPDGDIDLFYEYEYDKQGNMTYMAYQPAGEEEPTIEQWAYEYDKKQIVSASQILHLDTENEHKNQLQYAYSGNKLVKVYSINSQGIEVPGLMAEYDSKGRITQSVHVMMEWTMIYDYEYDAKGNLVEASFSSAPGRGMVGIGVDPLERANLRSSVRYEYDSKGRLTEVFTTDHEADVTVSTEYIYDGKNLVQIGDDYEFTYNGNKLTEATHDSEKYTFDKHGNLVESAAEDGETTRYTYKKLRLSKADAAAYYQQEMVRNQIHPSGVPGATLFDWRTVAMPTHPEILANPAYFAWRK